MKSSALIICLLTASLLTMSAAAQDQPAAAAEGTPAPAAAAATDSPAAPVAPAATETAPASAESAAAPAPTPAAAPVADGAFSQAVIDAIGKPSEGKALVVFFRPSKFAGAAVGFKVRENDVELGKLRNGNYFAIEVAPGQHAYVVHSEAKDVTNIEAEAGETYFLSGNITMGFMAGRPNLSPSDVTAFEAVLPKLKKSKPLD